MVLHMGGVFGDKEATLARFRENYARLPAGVKKRLVLENDDVSWTVHDLLPICEELNIPLVLDFHHNNILHSPVVREGTLDIVRYFDAIRATWTRKGITQKMHYSEPTPAAITGRQRRKHSPRVATLPPCAPDMDLMIEAKDKEQAVFELMRNFRLPGHDAFGDMVPHVRPDERPRASLRGRKGAAAADEDDDATAAAAAISDEEVSMGGPESRVYWPPGMEEWLRPMKRVVKAKDASASSAAKPAPAKSPAKAAKKPSAAAAKPDPATTTTTTTTRATKTPRKKTAAASEEETHVLTPSTTSSDDHAHAARGSAPRGPVKRRKSARAAAAGVMVDYAEDAAA